MTKVKWQEEKKVAPPVIQQDDLFSELSNVIEQAANNTSTWRDNQDKWHRMRMRIKSGKTFPFPGCANLRLPTIETKLRKLKSQLVSIILGVRPIVQAIPSPNGNLETAAKIEKWIDHLIMDVMNFKPKAVISIDQSIEKGFYLLKPYWRTEVIKRIEEYSLKDLSMEGVYQLYSSDTTPDMIAQALIQRMEVDMSELVADDNEKAIKKAVGEIVQGKDSIKVELLDVIYDYPDISLCNPEAIYVPSDSPYSPQDCRMVVHEFYLPYNTVKANVQFKKWSQTAVDNIWATKETLDVDSNEITKDTREGIERLNNPSQLVCIWECYTWYDIDDDGEDEKCVFTFAPDFGQTLRKITLPNNNAKFPFVKLVNELIDDRWFSHRGLPELIEDLVKEIDTQHNQKLDSQTLRNAPMVTYRAGIVNPNLIKFQPAQAVPRQEPDDVVFMHNTNLNAEFSYKDEQMILESKIEELVGQVDFTLQSMINRRQPRTKGEVELQVQNTQQVFSLDATLYTDAFSELFSMVWDMWCQYGNDNEEFSYFGENGWEKIRLNREEVQGKYKIVVRGNDQNFNPQQKQQKVSMIMNAVLNPIALQSGIVQPVNLYNLYKRIFQVLDEPNWQSFITDPTTLPPPPKPPAPVELKAENLTDKELAQVKAEQGIQPDVLGMMLEKQDEMHDKFSEGIRKNAPREKL